MASLSVVAMALSLLVLAVVAYAVSLYNAMIQVKHQVYQT